MRDSPRFSLALIILLGAAGWFAVVAMARAQGPELAVIPLRYRTAEQVIPVIQPMLAAGGTVSGLQGQLVVRTTPGNLAEIRRILASIDTAPRRLLITVRQDQQAAHAEISLGASGSLGTQRGRAAAAPGGGQRGAGASVREGDDHLRARVLDTRVADSDRNVQSVQVTEGSVAFIQVGESVPVPQDYLVRTYPGGFVREQYPGPVEYRDVTTGFYALARLAGDRVILEVSPQRDALSGRIPGGVDVQRAATTVSGRLGEWMEVAGGAQSASGERSVLLGRTSAAASATRRVLVKVEELKSP